MNLTAIPQLARNVNRLREIVTILGRYGLADWISRLDWDFAKGLLRGHDGRGLAAFTHETRIRLALTELGPTFIKFGQMLSTRADLIGPALAKELTALQANVPADAPKGVRRAVEAELGRPLEELFAEFDEIPVASASIGQVHRARLRSGQPVAVKVQHPGIETRIRIDLAILNALTELADQYLPEMRQYRPTTTAAEFQRTLLRELDFGREERNLQQFAANFAVDPTVRFPAPYAEFSTGRVLTMDWLEGLPIADPQQLVAAGFDQEEIARRGATVFLDMIFRDGFYHADPHPGNLLVLPGGVLGMLDCGMVGRLDENLREAFEEILLAIVQRDAVHLTSVIMRLGSVPPQLDPSGLNTDIADFVSYYGSQSLDQMDLGGALTEMTAIIRRYHIWLPAGVALLLKVLIMLEGTARLLNPRFNLIELMQPYQRKLLWRRLSPERHWQKLRRLVQEWGLLGEMLPRSLAVILQQMQKGRFELHLEHERLEPSVNRLVFGLLTSALFLGSALLWSFQAPPLLGGVSVLGALGCGISFVMGLRLLWAIRKSGRLGRRS